MDNFGFSIGTASAPGPVVILFGLLGLLLLVWIAAGWARGRRDDHD